VSQRQRHILAGIAAFGSVCIVGIVAIVGLVLTQRPVIESPAASQPVGQITPATGGEPLPVFGGWIASPEAVDEVKQALPPDERFFGDTPAGKSFGDSNQDVLLSDAAKRLLGSHLPARDQGSVGSCVAFGSLTAIEYLLIGQAIRDLQGPDAFKPLVHEVMYGGSRVEIGGGRIRGDGSVTAWAGHFAQKYGVIPRGFHGRHDLSVYNVARCRDYGQRGVPDDLEPVARQSAVKSITFARSADEAARAIRQGYSLAIGSQIGFGNRMPLTRDSEGFLRRSGSWGHCMAYVGVVGGKRPGFLCVNSWGERWVNGPTGGRDLPPGSFLIDYSTVDAMCREGDAIVFSDAVGFPARDPWWFVQAQPAPADRIAARPNVPAMGF
jgi:hypothetical protein